MDNPPLETASLLTTYQWMTISQIFERYALRLSDEDILTLLKHPHSLYYQLLYVPMTHLLNGLILEQAKAYQIYLQKMFVDYLMSGEADLDGDIPGAEDRETLEQARQMMLALSRAFDVLEETREQLIADSQREMMAWMIDFKKAVQSINAACQMTFPALKATDSSWYSLLIDAMGLDLTDPAWERFQTANQHPLTTDEKSWIQEQYTHTLTSLLPTLTNWIENYTKRVNDMRQQLMQYRKQFYDEIARVQGMIAMMPRVQVDEIQQKQHRAAIQFDSTIE